MSLTRNLTRLRWPVLAAGIGACLALVGCGGGGSPSTGAGGSASGGTHGPARTSTRTTSGSDSTACAAFTTAYKKFLAGYAPPESQTGTDETPLQALSDTVSKITASGQLNRDLADLGIDAGLIATGSTEGGQTTPPSAFRADVQAVGKDCATSFAQPPASLVRAG
jgi:hypothetical protein